MNDYLQKAFAAGKAYRGKNLADWLAKWVLMKTPDLEKVNRQFLTILTTWVVKRFAARRKGGVPVGNLGRFALPDSQKINFIEALCAFVILILRKRGLIEADRQPSDSFRRLLDAFDRAPRIK